MSSLLAATLAGCAALLGNHSDGVVVSSAKAVQPTDNWLPTNQRGYGPRPVAIPLCRVEGTIEGNIGFELWLPERWNGRYLGAGVGGDAGVFNYSDMSLRVSEGFAVASTDSGHKASQQNWMQNAKARQDYEHRALHLTTVAARKLTQNFYGQPVQRAYFTGCSGGGRQALKSMQTYPTDFDGVIAGAPGPNMPLQSVRMMWFALQQKWNPNAAVTEADWDLYERRATAACDQADGRKDGIIENPAACRFNIESLKCGKGQDGAKGTCIPADRLAMMKTVVAPLTDENGKQMDGGLFPGVRTRPGAPSPLLRAMWGDAVYADVNWNEDKFERTRDLMLINEVMPELRANRTSVNAFIRTGGKAIIYQGWADPSTNAGPTVDYYRGLVRDNGGEQALSESVRMFMVPGMYHCGRGPGADNFGASGQTSWAGDPQRDMLWALIRWVEDKQAPETITATKIQDGKEVFTRKLCNFPNALQYSSSNDAEGQCAPSPELKAYIENDAPAGVTFGS